MTHVSNTLPRPRRRSGFTLIEILVVIGILALLVGLLTPMVVRTMRRGVAMKTAADLNTISIALDAYKQDFGDYPRVTSGLIAEEQSLGAAILGMALLGPYGDGLLPNASLDPDDPPTYDNTKAYRAGQCVQQGGSWFVCTVATTQGIQPSNTDYWSKLRPNDGSDGPGFRTRPPVAGVAQGKVWGPYIKAENFSNTGLGLNDREGNPILYFSATSRQANVGLANNYVARQSLMAPGVLAKYNADQNIKPFRRPADPNDDNALARIKLVLGDLNTDGAISSAFGVTETAAATGDYILWTAGADGLFGPNDVIIAPGNADAVRTNARAVEKCDDVTNFR